jgi:hypothetical protein
MVAFFSMKEQVPGLIEPIDLSVDLAQLNLDVNKLWDTLGFQKKVFQKTRAINFNLTYPKNIPQSIINEFGELKSKFLGPLSYGETQVMNTYGISTASFTEMHDMVKNSYIKNVVDLVHNYHIANKGPASVQWVFTVTLGAGGGYKLHRDEFTAYRYHICLETNDFSFVIAKEKNSHELQTVHIPADGRVWLLDTTVMHTAWNLDYDTTSSRTHLIISISNQAA